MRKAGLVLVLTLAACERGAPPANAQVAPSVGKPAAAAQVNPDPGVRTYRCDDGRTLQAGYPDSTTAVVDVDGRAHPLRIAPSASGARYIGFGLQWWTKGMAEGRLSRLKDGETIASDPGVLCHAGTDVPAQAPSPGAPGGLPDDRRPLVEAPIAPSSAEGAAQVVQSYYALLESGREAQAWKLWSDGSPDRAASAEAFARQFDRFADYHAQIGAPGRVEGAAGSLYVEVPVVIYGRLKSGAEVHESGKATLRRVNDVPGSSEAQRSWRIYKIELRS
ncbi:MliC family protein [Phenylobacterium sp. LjRoot219]|uniref:MliC family protein n=1 Tax=Phenylobacterium sp. LjRoot219 TaxID=3342283 RepID=UPI003ECDB95A